MSVSAILQNSVSGLVVNQSALQTISQNVANVNNPNYVRRETVLENVMAGSQFAGVGIAEVRRIAAEFLDSELMRSNAGAAGTKAIADTFDRVQGFIGDPASPASVTAKLGSSIAAAAELTFDPQSGSRRLGYVQDLDAALKRISQLAGDVQELRADTDRQIGGQVDDANRYIERVYELNKLIAKADANGDSDTALKDERDAAIRSLSGLMDIRTLKQPDGPVYVTTADGFALATEYRTQLSYQSTGVAGTNASYPAIIAHRVDPGTNQITGSGTQLDGHLNAGSIASLMEMRDSELPGFALQLGELSSAIVDQLNAAHNSSVAVPPMNTLTGRNTGLLTTDSIGFTGTTTMAVVDSTGALVKRIDIDFGAATLSVDGGAATTIGTTIGNFVGALNTALGADGTASFTDGVLSVSAANSTSGIGFAEPTTGGSSRGGRSMSHYFGLNDLASATQNSHFQTGLSGTDPHSFTAGSTVEFQLNGPSGEERTRVTFTVPTGTTMANLVTQLNSTTSGLGTYMTFALGSDGALTSTPAAGYSGYTVDVITDVTQRGSTGLSFTQMFGIGRQHKMDQAMGLRMKADILSQPDRLALARLEISGATTAGDIVATTGDGRGAQALEGVDGNTVSFAAAGNLKATQSNVGDYFALIIATQSSLSAAADNLATDAEASMAEVESRRIGIEGVSLDEELAQMIIFQQAYSASARMITMAGEIYDQLLQLA